MKPTDDLPPTSPPTITDTERLRKHPLQYAIDSRNRAFYNTENAPTPPGEAWERFDRCPNCEEWSPCAVRIELTAEQRRWTYLMLGGDPDKWGGML